jgi:hypothetical protein
MVFLLVFLHTHDILILEVKEVIYVWFTFMDIYWGGSRMDL